MSDVTRIPTRHSVHALLRELGPKVAELTEEELAALRDGLEELSIERRAARRREATTPKAEALATYEIVNPSDEAYLDAPDFTSAIAAALVLGEGDYGLREVLPDPRVRSARVMPAFPMASLSQVTAWIKGTTGYASIDQLLTAKIPELAVILETVRLKHERSSMSDIVGRAKELARLMRENDTAEAPL